MAADVLGDITRILIVDDVEMNRYVLRNIITEMGYVPILSENGLQAQKILQRIPVQLILSDIAMPEMDGYELCRWVKSKPNYREIPFIFISAIDNPQDVVQGFETGGEDYITKPFIPEVVRARVGVHMKLNSAVKSLQESNRRLKVSVEEQLKQMEVEKKKVLYALAGVATEVSRYEESHMERIQYNCRMLSQAMQLSPRYESMISDSFVETIEIAAPLSDLGNMAIPTEILQKETDLSWEEQAIMQTHTTLGAKILMSIQTEGDYNDFIHMAIDVAKYHHENWDGSGYPSGKCGEQIPLAAQIVAVASSYSALTARRVYRDAYTREEALAMIQQEKDKMFNGEIVNILCKIARQLH